mmetsp:Transcript_11429/g.29168  ORF Transcript_11429/g.29168 Transcript_11429/m.29168 type:complete len:273 (-) Transcript_11429:1029-1847(-)
MLRSPRRSSPRAQTPIRGRRRRERHGGGDPHTRQRVATRRSTLDTVAERRNNVVQPDEIALISRLQVVVGEGVVGKLPAFVTHRLAKVNHPHPNVPAAVVQQQQRRAHHLVRGEEGRHQQRSPERRQPRHILVPDRRVAPHKVGELRQGRLAVHNLAAFERLGVERTVLDGLDPEAQRVRRRHDLAVLHVSQLGHAVDLLLSGHRARVELPQLLEQVGSGLEVRHILGEKGAEADLGVHARRAGEAKEQVLELHELVRALPEHPGADRGERS